MNSKVKNGEEAASVPLAQASSQQAVRLRGFIRILFVFYLIKVWQMPLIHRLYQSTFACEQTHLRAGESTESVGCFIVTERTHAHTQRQKDRQTSLQKRIV